MEKNIYITDLTFKKYETLALNRKLHAKKVSEKLNKVADYGWRLVTTYTNDISVIFIFERDF